MIDNIKISTTDFDYERLLNDQTFDFTSRFNTGTGEVVKNIHGNEKQEAFLHGLRIIVYLNHNNNYRLCIIGSIHKFFNNGTHNYNDFTYSDICTTIDRLSKIFYFDANRCTLHNIEIGVNINPPVKTSKILRGLLCHHNKEFKSISMNDAEYYQVRYSNYFIKIYNKARQYKAKGFHIEGEILRYELKYVKMIDLVKFLSKKQFIDRNYILLSDLQNIDVLIAFSELLIAKWLEILFYDHSISKKRLTNNQKQKLFAWRNKDYWSSLKKQQRSRQKIRLSEVILNHSQNLQVKLAELINNKVKMLLQKGLPFNQVDDVKKDDLLTNTINNAFLHERLPFNSIYKGLNGKPFEMLVPYVNEGEGESILNLEESKEKNDYSFIPNYDEFHNDTREIPF